MLDFEKGPLRLKFYNDGGVPSMTVQCHTEGGVITLPSIELSENDIEQIKEKLDLINGFRREPSPNERPAHQLVGAEL